MSRLTLYQLATDHMKTIVSRLLELSTATHNFTSPPDIIWQSNDDSTMLLCGQGYHSDELPPSKHRKNAWLARSAVPFGIERAATGILYRHLQPHVDSMIQSAYAETENFRNITSIWIHENPHLLPVMMHTAGIFSKQELKQLIGSVSDTRISKPAGERFVQFFHGTIPEKEHVRERMKATTEGIVRDLVGRVLLEQFVASALEKAKVPYQRESDYKTLKGVIYDFRADFVVSQESDPKAFIEVRKSSSRHASLYAKDKMFSAINWKGRHRECLGIIIVDGPWTAPSLDVMSRVFDYVIPITKAGEAAEKIRCFLDGDKTVLRWLIKFSIVAYKTE